jgi:cytochrome c-type biogenesis protein CcmH/NrfG
MSTVFGKIRGVAEKLKTGLTIARNARDSRKVIAICEEALKKDPNDTFAQYMLAYALDNTHQRTRAAEIRHSILKRNPDDFPALRGLADYYAQRGNVTLACEAMRRALTLEQKEGVPLPRWLPRRFRQHLERKFVEIARNEASWRQWAAEYLAVHDAEPSEDGPVN